MNDLNNRVALVTGASRGIGTGIAIALARAGANIAVNYHKRADAAKTVCDEIRAMGRNAIPVQADVSVTTDVKYMVKEVEHFLGASTSSSITPLLRSRASWKTFRNRSGTRY